MKQLQLVHLVDMNGKPTVISTFAGCGGSSLGYKWAGFKELLAIDFEKNAVDTFKLNFKEVPAWLRDIKTVTAEEILNFCGIKPGELDVLDGSPPCQGFSTAGKRQVNDTRNDLFKEFVRLIEELQPKVFVMENVSGMTKGKMKGMFIQIIKTLKSLNYQVKCKQMNAKYYGVPQSRERLIFIGVRNDLKIEPEYPDGSNKLISPSEIIPELKGKKFLTFRNRKGVKDAVRTTRLPAPAITSRLSMEGRIDIDDICILKKLQSFPINFEFTENTINKSRQRIGNSVPPKMMQAITTTIKKKILGAT